MSQVEIESRTVADIKSLTHADLQVRRTPFGYEFSIPLRMELKKWPDGVARLVAVEARLYAERSEGLRDRTLVCDLRRTTLLDDISTEYAGRPICLAFSSVMASDRLAVLNDFCGKLELRLVMKATLTFWLPSSEGGEAKNREREIERSLVVPRANWHEIMNRAGFARSLLLEVQVPTTDGQPGTGWSEVEPLLQGAVLKHQQGYSREAVVMCRDCLERAITVFGLQDAVTRAAKIYREGGNPGRRQMSLFERQLLLVHGVRHAAGVAAHVDVPVSWTVHHSKSLVQMTVSLVEWLGHHAEEVKAEYYKFLRAETGADGGDDE